MNQQAQAIGQSVRNAIDYLFETHDGIDYSTALDAAIQGVAATLRLPEESVLKAYDEWHESNYNDDI